MAFWHIFEDPVAKTKMSENFTLQWGSEIRTSLDFEWSKRGWVTNGPDFEWDLKFGSPTISNLDLSPILFKFMCLV